jgi:hypothetical protein
LVAGGKKRGFCRLLGATRDFGGLRPCQRLVRASAAAVGAQAHPFGGASEAVRS